jgi:glycerophosphoryl diester phosphodiesterase
MGSGIKPENKELDKFLNAEGVMCMISAGPQYDKLKTTTERADAYRAIFEDGASILESDFPIEVSEATKEDLDC